MVLEFPHDLTAANGAERLIERRIDVFAHEPDMPVGHQELGASDVMAAEIVEVSGGVIRAMIHRPENTLPRLFSTCNHARPGGPPAESLVCLSFSDKHCVARPVCEISQACTAVVIDRAIPDALPGS